VQLQVHNAYFSLNTAGVKKRQI